MTATTDSRQRLNAALARITPSKYCARGEDTILANLFEYMTDDVGGSLEYIVDIGAGVGPEHCNSQMFVDKGWDNLRIDGGCTDPNHAKRIRITAENVVEVLRAHDVPMTFGILCLDIDGIDLYVLDAVLQKYEPLVIVFEFNANRDPEGYDVIAYHPAFEWYRDDYYGASWSAFQHVLKTHGYTCVHQVDSLNGFAVPAFSGLPRCPTPPSYPWQQPAQRPDATWKDSRQIFGEPSTPMMTTVS